MSNEVEFLVRFIASGLRVIAARLVLFVAMLLAFGLYAWVMYQPDLVRLGAAGFFSIIVFLPILRLDFGGEKKGDG